MPRPRDLFDALLIASIVTGLLVLFYLAFATPLLESLTTEIKRGNWQSLLMRPTFLWLCMGLVLLSIRTFLWLTYRPFPFCPDDQLPFVTVIIPAYNEGAMVERAIDSVARSDYPEERLEIIAVDDGSRDATWQYMQSAARRHPGRIAAVQFAANRGKRAALSEGFRRATGSIVVTMDSDSILQREALRALVAPFVSSRVGAVAGHVAVLNRRASLLTRMLQVRFVLGFDFLRSAQSTYGTVYCCPGALSAYRIDAVRAVLPRWERQTFLGVPCTYGEDRALTNMLLEQGYDSVYQCNAVVHTLVPDTYAKACKMLLRWTRSYIREEFHFLSRVVWKRPRVKRTFALAEGVVANLRYPVGYAAIVLWVFRAYQDPQTVLRMLFAVGAAAGFYSLYYLRSERSWDFVYGILYAYFSLFFLTWIFPYALLTVKARGWLTR
jgi:hyaluronan synthase